jgi:protein-tyrosine phosphatase
MNAEQVKPEDIYARLVESGACNEHDTPSVKQQDLKALRDLTAALKSVKPEVLYDEDQLVWIVERFFNDRVYEFDYMGFKDDLISALALYVSPEDEETTQWSYADAWDEGGDDTMGKFDFLKSSGWNKGRDDYKGYTGATSGSTGSSGTTGSSGPVTTYKEKCRHVETDVFVADGVTYHGGSESKISEVWPKGWLVVNLTGFKRKDSDKALLTGDETLVKALSEFMERDQAIYLNVDWKDYGAPPTVFGFFRRLHEAAIKHNLMDVVFYCLGGHGRTGTALASMLIEVGGYSAKQAYDAVKLHYCKEAIESNSQIVHLNDTAAHWAAQVGAKFSQIEEIAYPLPQPGPDATSKVSKVSNGK